MDQKKKNCVIILFLCYYYCCFEMEILMLLIAIKKWRVEYEKKKVIRIFFHFTITGDLDLLLSDFFWVNILEIYN